jgi:hypothetical protein
MTRDQRTGWLAGQDAAECGRRRPMKPTKTHTPCLPISLQIIGREEASVALTFGAHRIDIGLTQVHEICDALAGHRSPDARLIRDALGVILRDMWGADGARTDSGLGTSQPPRPPAPDYCEHGGAAHASGVCPYCDATFASRKRTMRDAMAEWAHITTLDEEAVALTAAVGCDRYSP